MKKVKTLLLVCIPAISIAQGAPASDSIHLIYLNQLIDTYVIEKNVAALDTMYAGDFVFSHGSGRVEGKQGWLRSVGRNNYPVRKHDSVRVEVHAEFAVVKGNMSIHRQDKDKLARYHLKYIRVYAWRKSRWWLASHSTTHETHEN